MPISVTVQPHVFHDYRFDFHDSVFHHYKSHLPSIGINGKTEQGPVLEMVKYPVIYPLFAVSVFLCGRIWNEKQVDEKLGLNKWIVLLLRGS